MNFWLSTLGLITVVGLCATILYDSKVRHRIFWKKMGRKVIYLVDESVKNYTHPDKLKQFECYPLLTKRYVLGRNGLKSDIAVTRDDAFVSREAFEIFHHKNDFRIRCINQEEITVYRDSASTTIKKGQSDALVLQDGDIIRLGKNTTILFKRGE